MRIARPSTHQPQPSTSAAMSRTTPTTNGAGVDSSWSRESRSTAFMRPKLYRRAAANRGGAGAAASAAQEASVERDDDRGVLRPGVGVRRWRRRGDGAAGDTRGPHDLADPGVGHRRLDVDDAL